MGFLRFRWPHSDKWYWLFVDYLAYDPEDCNSNDIITCLRVTGKWYDVETDEWQRGEIDLGNVILNLDIPPLGYINTKYATRFVVRAPTKQYSRILFQDMLVAFFPQGLEDMLPMNERYVEWRELMFQQVGEPYPPLRKCIYEIENGYRLAMAFSPDYALAVSPYGGNKIWVLQHNRPVGVLDKVSDEYIMALPKQADYIVEDLMQYGPTAVYV